MEFRKAKKKDSQKIMEIIKAAQKYFKKEAIDQWQNDYPNQKTIKKDIENNNLYVIEIDDEIAAAAAIIFAPDPFYNQIEAGNWISNGKYGVIHRAAAAEKYKGRGLMGLIFAKTYQLAEKKNLKSVRIDTHPDNAAMLRAIEKENFSYCGIVYVQDGSKRLAYEKIL